MTIWSPERALAAPRALLAALLLATTLLVPVAAQLKLEGSVIDLLPRSSPAAQAFATFTQSMVSAQELIILVVCDDGERLIRFADEYAEKLARLPDAREVTHRVSSHSVAFLRQHLLLLLDSEEIAALAARTGDEALRRQVRRLRALLSVPGGGALAPVLSADPLELVPLITSRLSSGLPVDTRSGYFRTADGKALLIKLRPGFDPMDFTRSRALMDQAALAARRLGAEVAEGSIPKESSVPVVAFTGSYAYPPYYRQWLEQDLSRSTTLSIVAVLLLFAIFFRALRILPVVLVPLLCAGVWTAAAAVALFGRVNGVSLAFGTILVAIGIDLPIQIYNRLREELLTGAEARRAVSITIDALAAPAILATLGPAAVFFCCGLSDYRGLHELGILAGVGLCLNCLAMLTLFPALLLCLPMRIWHGAATTSSDRRRGRGVLHLLGFLATRYPRGLLLFALGLCLLGLPAAKRLGFDRRLFSLEPRDMPPAVAQDEIARRFGDRQRFLVALIEDADTERALRRADLLTGEIERLRRAGLIKGYESLSTLLPSARTQEERRAALLRLDLPRVAERLRRVLDEEGLAVEPFAEFLAQLERPPAPLTLAALSHTEVGALMQSHLAVTGDGRERTVISLYLFVPVDEPIDRLLAALAPLKGGEIAASFTGLPLLERELHGIVERDARVVTLASIGVVVLLLVLTYRRARPIAAVLLPLGLAWVLFAACMVWLRIPLNLYNLLAVPLCIGYGIDDHVFLVHRYLRMPGGARDPARVLSTTGRAVVLTSLSTMVGFAGLGVAHFEGLRLLGLSGALAVLLCLLAACLVLPPLLALLFDATARRDDP